MAIQQQQRGFFGGEARRRTKFFVSLSSLLVIFLVSLFGEQTRLTRYIRRRLFTHDARLMRGEKILYTQVSRYPGNNWDFIDPVGAIRLAFQPSGSFGAQYYFVKLEPICGGVNCVIDIREGTSCDDADLVGDQYYDPVKTPGNPFRDAKYHSYQGIARGGFGIYTGLGYDEYVGHALVINSMGGHPIACGILEPWVPPQADAMIQGDVMPEEVPTEAEEETEESTSEPTVGDVPEGLN